MLNIPEAPAGFFVTEERDIDGNGSAASWFPSLYFSF
jgi:hypothetical protein